MVDAEANVEDDAWRAPPHADLVVVKTLNVSYDKARLVLPGQVSQYTKAIVAIEPERPVGQSDEPDAGMPPSTGLQRGGNQRDHDARLKPTH